MLYIYIYIVCNEGYDLYIPNQSTLDVAWFILINDHLRTPDGLIGISMYLYYR